MSAATPALKPREVLRALGKAGFYVHHVTGSHHILKHPSKPGLRVTIPFHGRDLKRGTLASIIKQAGLTTEEFIALLRCRCANPDGVDLAVSIILSWWGRGTLTHSHPASVA